MMANLHTHTHTHKFKKSASKAGSTCWETKM